MLMLLALETATNVVGLVEEAGNDPFSEPNPKFLFRIIIFVFPTSAKPT